MDAEGRGHLSGVPQSPFRVPLRPERMMMVMKMMRKRRKRRKRL